MAKVQAKRSGGVTHYTLGGKALSNDDEVELRMGGNRGWMPVTVTGLPDALRVTWTNDDDDKPLQTTVPPEAQLRWP